MISPTSAVVVVLPLEPVIASVLPFRNRAANSSSRITGNPKLFPCASSGVFNGTPGLTTLRSCLRKVSRPWPPVSTMMPSSSSAGMSLASASALRTSETVTCAPRLRRNNAAARPDLPSPTTRTFFPFSSIIRTYPFGACDSSILHRKHQCADPEPGNHFGLAPAQLFEVVMQRRHLKDTLSIAQLVAAHLQNHRQRFQQENA